MKASQRGSFLRDLFGQVASEHPRIDAGRWCAHNAFVGTILLGGALVLRLSGPPDPLGPHAFVLVAASALGLILAAVVPLLKPGLVPAVLAADGVLVIALTFGFAFACLSWARQAVPMRSFRYLPGLIATGATYGAALWADFGPVRVHARRWRQAGFVVGVVLDGVVGVFVIAAALRA